MTQRECHLRESLTHQTKPSRVATVVVAESPGAARLCLNIRTAQCETTNQSVPLVKFLTQMYSENVGGPLSRPVRVMVSVAITHKTIPHQ